MVKLVIMLKSNTQTQTQTQIQLRAKTILADLMMQCSEKGGEEQPRCRGGWGGGGGGGGDWGLPHHHPNAAPSPIYSVIYVHTYIAYI